MVHREYYRVAYLHTAIIQHVQQVWNIPVFCNALYIIITWSISIHKYVIGMIKINYILIKHSLCRD